MARGVKKIIMYQGKYYNKTSTNVTIPPEKPASFKVEEWFSGTTEDDKKNAITWMRQSNNRKTILYQLKSKTGYYFSISKKLCGPYTFYVEASLSGKRDFKNPSGLYINGYTKALIKGSNWRKTPTGNNIKNGAPIKYGELVYIWLDTEGLNGDTVTIEVYNQTIGADNYIDRYTNVKVVNGEVAFKIGNTKKWLNKVGWYTENVEEFYIKVKKGSGNTYIKDHLGADNHAIYLNIKNEVVDKEAEVSENLTPTKVYKAEVNAERHEPCKFDKVTISLPLVKDGKASTKTITIFEDGVTKIKSNTTDEKINRSIHFKFNDYSIAPDAQKKLNNILGFLLGHKGTTIMMTGYACVIGKADYNKNLSQQRSDSVKTFFVNGGLDSSRIISIGRGEYNIQNPDDYKNKNEEVYVDARRVDISFTFHGHTANAAVFETTAPSSKQIVTLDVLGFDTEDCYRNAEKHKEEIIVKSPDAEEFKETNPSLQFPIQSTLSKYNVAPIQYIWPKFNILNWSDSATLYKTHIHSCRYYSNQKAHSILIKAYPDIKWELEFKWNHTESFAYSYGNEMHPYDIEKGQEKVIGSTIDRGLSENFGEMAQSFELSLKAKWDEDSQNLEIGKEWGKKIAKTLKLFNKMKAATDAIAKSPINGGKLSFEIKAPVIAVSAKWYLETPKNNTKIGTNITIGIESKPLIEAEGKINLWKIFREYGPNAICPGAGTVVNFVLEHIEGNVGISFMVIFTGSINAKGQVQGNTLVPTDTKGEIGIIGKIQVTMEFKAWANGEIGMASFEGYVKADVSTYVSGGIKAEVSKVGLYGYPELNFGGIIAKYVAVGSVKFGIFKRTFEKKGEYVIVEPNKSNFSKKYIIGPYK